MRKIEQEMVNAVRSGRDWAGSNTMVNHSATGADVFLHGHHIAHVSPHGDVVTPNLQTLANWPTNTTKSRLRALGVNVYTKNYVTYVDGQEV